LRDFFRQAQPSVARSKVVYIRGVLSPDLCIARLPAKSSEEAIRALAARLVAAGCVKPSFEAAALARERRSPTGLPFPLIAVAIPHAEPEHVVRPAIAVASLAAPVAFREMGNPAVRLDVSLVVMPALTAKEQAAAELSRLIELLQNEPLRRALAGAETADAMGEILAPLWRP
jgi:PTS system galactitol-specific IIA component